MSLQVPSSLEHLYIDRWSLSLIYHGFRYFVIVDAVTRGEMAPLPFFKYMLLQ